MENTERTIYTEMQVFLFVRMNKMKQEGSGVLGCDPVLLSEVFLIFCRNVFPLFSGCKHLPLTQPQSFTSQKTKSSVCKPVLTANIHICDISVQDVKVSS